jgi:hypothetical protein
MYLQTGFLDWYECTINLIIMLPLSRYQFLQVNHGGTLEEDSTPKLPLRVDIERLLKPPRPSGVRRRRRLPPHCSRPQADDPLAICGSRSHPQGGTIAHVGDALAQGRIGTPVQNTEAG